jgi:restriction system protein
VIQKPIGRRRPIDEAEVTDAIDWIERIALAIAHVLDDEG